MSIKNKKEHLAFKTHLNYIKCLSILTEETTLQYRGSLPKRNLLNIDHKKNLIDLTKKSLNDEYKIVSIDKDYSYASTSWLPIKSYYLIFNILLTIEYIFTMQKNTFMISHNKCIDEFTRKLKNKTIQFSNQILNQVFDQSIFDHKVESGSNLSSQTTDSDMYKMVIRKIANYKRDEWKQRERINVRKSNDKSKLKTYMNKFSVSIFHFPYYMRIRANYRDFTFINGVTSAETADYFNKYFKFTLDFVNMLENLKQDLINPRAY